MNLCIYLFFFIYLLFYFLLINHLFIYYVFIILWEPASAHVYQLV